MSELATGTTHHVPFSASGLTGLTLLGFIIRFFTVDGLPVDTTTQGSLALEELGFGYYQLSYVPSVIGYHLLIAHNAAHNFDVIDGVDITDAKSYLNLTQDTGGFDNLQPTSIPNISSYLLMVFLSSDWQVGRTDPTFAVASTGLDANGNWLATPLVIQHGTYHIVVRSNTSTVVIKPFLEV